MKNAKIILILMLSLFYMNVFSQVGINTESPKAMLDVNGNLRLRTAEKCIEVSCADSILVKSNSGYVRTISKEQILNTNARSYVSGTGNGSQVLLAVSGISNWLKILFNKKIIDNHNDFDTSNNTFTAPEDGIYEVYVQLKTSSAVSVGDFGVGVYVKRGANPPELVAEETYLNVSVLGIDVSPSTRKTQTMVALNSGDNVFFCVKTTLPSLGLLSGGSSLFTIYQIK